jgi:hypothetical protein
MLKTSVMMNKLWLNCTLAQDEQIRQIVVTESSRLVRSMQDSWGRHVLGSQVIDEEPKSHSAPLFYTYHEFIKTMNEGLAIPFDGSLVGGRSAVAEDDDGLTLAERMTFSSFDLDTGVGAFFEKEVTFFRFLLFYWRRFSEDLQKLFDPASVWTEFQSVIRGGFEVHYSFSFLVLN